MALKWKRGKDFGSDGEYLTAQHAGHTYTILRRTSFTQGKSSHDYRLWLLKVDGEVPDHGRWLTGLNTVKAQAEAVSVQSGH